MVLKNASQNLFRRHLNTFLFYHYYYYFPESCSLTFISFERFNNFKLKRPWTSIERKIKQNFPWKKAAFQSREVFPEIFIYIYTLNTQQPSSTHTIKEKSRKIKNTLQMLFTHTISHEIALFKSNSIISGLWKITEE